ncbi:dihydroneopterin aldolase [Schaalia cardiffensis F0333]|uniref:Bifunctional folate synthesis protein n=1 Tax=Schaalia cardiffensis F0333 TaxID=888050 RepID=N6X3D5_9ACTO|nr:2-amino-4-hydroxy-6-hydroxymethyldihydropteridine diphosphokinase [Schaalia cardiffensis]ENO17957.1 dihydroneopterin aldolase [Schaalia cardiffensis F0333]
MSRPLDVITLRGLAAEAIHGVLPDEHLAAQPFVVDLRMWLDASEAARLDEIEETVSYAQIAEEIAAILTGPSVRLLETLGQRIADAVLAHERILGVEVTVHKPQAPIAQTFSDVSVTVRRGQIDAAPALSSQDATFSIDTPASSTTPLPSSPVLSTQPPALPPSSPARGALSEPREEAWDTIEKSDEPAHVVLALGGNIGDAPTRLAAAVEALVDSPEVDVLDVSPLLRTCPVLAEGQEPQADYWNAVVLMETRLDPYEVLELARELEAEAGRVRSEHWGPRTLDVDVIDYEGCTLADGDLILPHPRAATRAFVLAPWLMVDEDAHLGDDSVAELLRCAPDTDGIIDAVDEWLLEPGSVIAESDALLETAHNETPEETHFAETQGGLRASASSTVSSSRLSTTTRLDFMPEELREGLAPSGEGDDLVWRRLWERWSQPMTQDALAAVDPRRKTLLRPAPMANGEAEPATGSAALEKDTRVENTTTQSGNQRAGDAFEAQAPAPTRAPQAPAQTRASQAPAPTRATHRHDRASSWDEAKTRTAQKLPASRVEATAAGEDREANSEGKQPRLRWLPLAAASETRKNRQAKPTETQRPSERASTREEEGATVQEEHRDLPSWDFARGDVRIVDEPTPRTLHVEAEASAAPESTVRRSIMDPELHSQSLRADVADTENTKTGLLRKIVVRPSTTGQIPIFKDRDHR